METRRWINMSLPQTLANAVILLYINAAFAVLFGAVLGALGLVLTAAMVGAGYGIANERRWGYQLGVGVAFAPAVLRFLFAGGINGIFAVNLIGLVFEILLIALLVHPQSREYQRIWFS